MKQNNGKHANERIWKKIDTRAIIIGTILQRTEKEKEKQKFQTGETNQTPEEKENKIVQNDLEYADDTQLLIAKDTHG